METDCSERLFILTWHWQKLWTHKTLEIKCSAGTEGISDKNLVCSSSGIPSIFDTWVWSWDRSSCNAEGPGKTRQHMTGTCHHNSIQIMHPLVACTAPTALPLVCAKNVHQMCTTVLHQEWGQVHGHEGIDQYDGTSISIMPKPRFRANNFVAKMEPIQREYLSRDHSLEICKASTFL